MAGPGRNDRCPCGSGRKVKRCCGVRRGPSEDELAKAFLAVEARRAAGVLDGCDDEELDGLCAALADEDLEGVRASLAVVVGRLDTPRGRAGLARAVLARRDAGVVGAQLAAAAVIDLASGSTRLVRASVLEAVAVEAGAAPAAGGLIVVAR